MSIFLVAYLYDVYLGILYILMTCLENLKILMFSEPGKCLLEPKTNSHINNKMYLSPFSRIEVVDISAESLFSLSFRLEVDVSLTLVCSAGSGEHGDMLLKTSAGVNCVFKNKGVGVFN